MENRTRSSDVNQPISDFEANMTELVPPVAGREFGYGGNGHQDGVYPPHASPVVYLFADVAE